MGNRSFSRTGVYGLWYLGKFDLSTFYMHGQDNVFLGNGVQRQSAIQPAIRRRGADLERRLCRSFITLTTRN